MLLGFILHVANTSPPIGLLKDRFYAMKQRILELFGTLDGHDIQYITKRCWGSYGYAGCQGEDCPKCGGSGIYNFFWVKLERWQLGSYTFHRPIDRRQSNPWGKVTIEGLIEHRRYSGWWANEAQLWLALFFDRSLFRDMFWYRLGRPCAFWLPPLVFLSKLRYDWRHRKAAQKSIPF